MIDISQIEFSKYKDGLLPTVVQSAVTKTVLMLGFSTKESIEKTLSTKKATFYSRKKNDLWTKGETSGNFLNLVSAHIDCDNDTLLYMVIADGTTCHKGNIDCFDIDKNNNIYFLDQLQKTIVERKNNPTEGSYTSSLFSAGLNKVAQKVGEEAVETVIASLNENDDAFLNESADLIYHLTVLLAQKGYTLQDAVKVLVDRSKAKINK